VIGALSERCLQEMPLLRNWQFAATFVKPGRKEGRKEGDIQSLGILIMIGKSESLFGTFRSLNITLRKANTGPGRPFLIDDEVKSFSHYDGCFSGRRSYIITVN
jgi:hypothetical protein